MEKIFFTDGVEGDNRGWHYFDADGNLVGPFSTRVQAREDMEWVPPALMRDAQRVCRPRA